MLILYNNAKQLIDKYYTSFINQEGYFTFLFHSFIFFFLNLGLIKMIS